MTDVTTYISAEEYLISVANRSRMPEDPYGILSYSQLAQTFIFYDDIYISHPMLKNNCDYKDFGKEQIFLSKLFEYNIVKPLNIPIQLSEQFSESERKIQTWLLEDGKSRLLKLITNIDDTKKSKIVRWLNFQCNTEKVKQGHYNRITTSNGIEDDFYGNYATEFAVENFKKIRFIPENQLNYFIATLIRTLKYKNRSNNLNYQYSPHYIRKDFSLLCDLYDVGIDETDTYKCIQAIEEIPEKLAGVNNNDVFQDKIKLLTLKMPLLSGKLWSENDIDKYKNSFIDFAVEQIAQYREKSRDVRKNISAIKTEEDCTSLMLQFHSVYEPIISMIKSKSKSKIDNSLIKEGFACYDSSHEIPICNGMQITFNSDSQSGGRLYSCMSPIQQFIYREFQTAWDEVEKQTESIYVPDIFTGDKTLEQSKGVSVMRYEYNNFSGADIKNSNINSTDSNTGFQKKSYLLKNHLSQKSNEADIVSYVNVQKNFDETMDKIICSDLPKRQKNRLIKAIITYRDKIIKGKANKSDLLKKIEKILFINSGNMSIDILKNIYSAIENIFV